MDAPTPPNAPSAAPNATPNAADTGTTGYWRALFYRWFVEYNPLYLLSAALVLGGCVVWSRGLVDQDSLSESLGIAFVAELYAASLIGGVALLTRIGMRRPAVMLALLSLLYQWDTTLHTETCAYLGAAGAWATAAWVALCVGKVYALAWALRVRFARHAISAAVVAALGLALGPRILPGLGARGAGVALAAWVFALGALYEPGAITSLVELDPWGRTVLRRATRAAWLVSAALLAVHVAFWWRDHDIAVASLLPAAPLLLVRRVRSERRAWALVVGTLVVVGVIGPSAFFCTSLLAAAALTLRALAPRLPPEITATPSAADAAQPYRVGGVARSQEAAPSIVQAAVVDAAERARLLTGAAFALYLAAWTAPWTGGGWPAHVLVLDLALTVLVVLAVWRARVRAFPAPLAPIAALAASYGHFVVQAQLVPAPRSSGEWGASAVALGFVLLLGSLATSYRLRARPLGEGGS